MSTKRTPVRLVAIDTIASAEATDLALHALLLRLEPRELSLPLRERAQVLGYKPTYGTATLRGAYPRGTVDIVRDRNGYVSHCESQYHSITGYRHSLTTSVVAAPSPFPGTAARPGRHIYFPDGSCPAHCSTGNRG